MLALLDRDEEHRWFDLNVVKERRRWNGMQMFVCDLFRGLQAERERSPLAQLMTKNRHLNHIPDDPTRRDCTCSYMTWGT